MSESVLQPGNPVNEPSASVPRTRSKFNLSYHLYNTDRFGEYTPHYVADVVEGDRFPVRSGGSVQSYSMKAPLMQSITKKKDYFQVPMMAILPLNWDKFYTNPVIGDDVPDDVGTGVLNFWSNAYTLSERLRNAVLAILQSSSATYASIPKTLTAVLRTMVTLEFYYSNGSLISSLGCHGSRFFRVINHSTYQKLSFDQFFDLVLTTFVNNVGWFQFTDSDGCVKYVVNDNGQFGYLRASYPCVDIHAFLQYLRDDLNVAITDVPSTLVRATIGNTFATFFDSDSSKQFEWIVGNIEQNYNLNRLWAYQLVCAHFYSNDHVDFIYSADLFRELIAYYCCYSQITSLPKTFTMNGLTYQYDWLSAKNYSAIVGAIVSSATNAGKFIWDNVSGDVSLSWRGYLSALFSYRRSLRFVDYFTGSRTRPLAVGDVNVDVNSGSPNYVNVIDVTRNIQRQRFFNAANRLGRKIEQYVKGLTGVSMAPDYHNPLYLAHTSDTVYGVQVENTGSDQLTQKQSVTSRLVSNGSRYMFEFEVDRPSVVIGISYYDIRRAYLFGCERPLFHMNRFDMFNPYMQFIGDQDVYFGELGSGRAMNYNGTFGYQLRHMEYKQRFDQAAGGFVENLPGYIFTNSDDDSRGNAGQLSVDFIHSLNSELDDFYVNLTGYSLGSYFHFIVDNDNNCEASRQMAYAPTIL